MCALVPSLNITSSPPINYLIDPSFATRTPCSIASLNSGYRITSEEQDPTTYICVGVALLSCFATLVSCTSASYPE